MQCPVCENVSLAMSERQGVEIDYCSKCRGVWLDRGELDKILEKSTMQQHAGPGDRHEHQDQQHYGHKHYRKKSIWHEIFD